MNEHAEKWKSRIVRYEDARVDQITANPKNFRIHPQHQRDALDGVIREVGVVQNVIINERTGNLVDGHLRVDMAIQNGEETVPATVVDLSESEESLILSTIDPLSALATTDANKLDDLLRDVRTNDQAIQDMLTDLAEGAGILPPEEPTGKPDPEPDLPEATKIQEQWNVKFGDVWVAGGHTIYCGDCLEIEIADDIDLVYADPPYGISAVKTKTGKVHGEVNDTGRMSKLGTYAPIKGDETGDLAKRAWAMFSERLPDADHVWWGANHYAEVLPDTRCFLVWDKECQEVGLADGELAWSNADKSVKIFRHEWRGMMKATERGEKRTHPTQKPVALAEWVYSIFDPQVILDPFAGVGASVIGAERTGRRAIAVEYMPEYVAVILERLKAEGLEPRLKTTPSHTPTKKA